MIEGGGGGGRCANSCGVCVSVCGMSLKVRMKR